jgi:hypothetical protein
VTFSGSISMAWCGFPATSCALLHLYLVLHGSLTLSQYDFVEREAERLCCSTSEVVSRLVEAEEPDLPPAKPASRKLWVVVLWPE